MDVRERDDEDPGWDGLPGGLAFLDDGPADDDHARTGVLGTVVWTLVLALLVGVGAFAGWRYAGSADVRAVLASSTSTYARVLGGLRTAVDAEELAAVAQTAPAAADDLAGDLDRLRSTDGERRAAVADQVRAERDVLLAVGELAAVDRAPLRAWGEVHEELTAAVTAELQARSVLRGVDAGAARRLPDTTGTMRDVTATVGVALVSDVTRTAGDLLDDLAASATTADLRTAAGRAGPQREAVLAAGAGLGGTDEGRVLSAFAAALQAVADLRDLTPAETGSWPGARGRLSEQLAVVADAGDSLQAGSVRGRLPLVLTALDALVARAEAAHAAWQPVYDAAVAAQANDSTALRRYADLVRARTPAWTQLRADLTALVGRAGGTSPDELERALAALSASASRVGSEIDAAPLPAGLEAAETAVLQAVAGVTGPLDRAVAELRPAPCADCPQPGEGPAAGEGTGPGGEGPSTPGSSAPPSGSPPAPADPAAAERARRLLDEAVAAAPAWDVALAALDAGVAAAQAAIDTRPLPPPPDA